MTEAEPVEGRDYRLDGLPQAPWLVLLGSLGTTTAVWDRQVPALRAWFRVLRTEHPGHGGAGVPAGQGTVEALGQRLVATLDRLEVDRAHVAGLSLGGLVGIWLAANHPERVDRLVLACTAGRFNAAESYRHRAATVRAEGVGQLVPAALSRWFTEPFASRYPDVAAEYAAMLGGAYRSASTGRGRRSGPGNPARPGRDDDERDPGSDSLRARSRCPSRQRGAARRVQ